MLQINKRVHTHKQIFTQIHTHKESSRKQQIVLCGELIPSSDVELKVREGFLEEATFELRPATQAAEGHSRPRAWRVCSRSKFAWSKV